MPRLVLSPVPPDRADADLLVLPVAAGAAGRFTGALDDALVVPAYGTLAAPAVLLVGVGPDAGRTPETLRRAAAVAVAAAGKAATLAVALHRAGEPGDADGTALAAVAEGTALAAYRFSR